MKYLLVIGFSLLLGGCSIQQSVQPVTEYRLKPYAKQTRFADSQCTVSTLRVALTQSSALLQRQSILYADDSYRQYAYTKARWIESPSRQLRHLFEDAITRSGLFKSVVTYDSQARNDLLLENKVNDFMQYFGSDGKSHVHLSMELILIDQESMQVIATKHVDIKKETVSADAQGAVEAFNQILQEMMAQTMEWLHGECK